MASPRSLLESPPSTQPPQPSLIVHTLLAMAKQRDGLSEAHCRTVLEFIETGGVLRTKIQQQLALEGLSRGKLDLLLALLAIDPIPATISDLALHTGASRSSVSTVVAALVRQHLVVCLHGSPGRRLTCIRLTEAGRNIADRAAMRCLRLLGAIAQRLPATLQADLRLSCALLQQGAARCNPNLPSLTCLTP